jgi:hypothetical protein
MTTATRIRGFPGIFYYMETPQSKEMQRMLDSLDANYELARADKAGLPEPLYVFDGSFLSCQVLKEELARFGTN